VSAARGEGWRRGARALTPLALLALLGGCGGEGAGAGAGAGALRLPAPLPCATALRGDELTRLRARLRAEESAGGAAEGEAVERGEEARAALSALALRDPRAALRAAPWHPEWAPHLAAAGVTPAPGARGGEGGEGGEGGGGGEGPARLPSLWLAADLLVSLGAPLEGVLRPLLRADLRSERALTLLRAHPAWAPLGGLALDPSEEIRAWERSGWAPLREGAVGQVLDEQLIALEESGAGVRVVSEALRVNSRRGVEELGEVALPPTATLLSLYTQKPSGARLAPVVIPEKEGHSLQDLQVGDYIVARYFEPLEPARRSGGALTPWLPLRDPARATWRRAAHVWRRGAAGGALREERRGWGRAPAGASLRAGRRDEGEVVSLEVTRAAALPAEPGGALEGHWPALRVGAPTDEGAEWAALTRALAARLLVSADERAALRAVGGAEEAAGAAAWALLPEERPLLDSPPPAAAAARREGSRAVLLWGLLDAAGARCALWLARPRGEGLAPTAFEAADDYARPLVACEGEGVALALYDPALPLSPRGAVMPELLGGEARAVWPPTPAACRWLAAGGAAPAPPPRALVPWPRAPQERHLLRAHLRLDPTAPRGLLGARGIAVEVTHEVGGAEGALLYERLRRARPEEVSRWVEGQWARWLGASARRDAGVSWSERGGLLLRYALTVTARLPARLSPAPQSWGRRFGALGARVSPLSLDPVWQEVELSAEGLTLEAPPARLVLEGGARAEFRREGGGARAALRWSLRGGLVAPEGYAAWAALARAVEEAEWVTLRALGE